MKKYSRRRLLSIFFEKVFGDLKLITTFALSFEDTFAAEKQC